LYGLQQELAKYQMLLEREHDKFNETQQNRLNLEKDLINTRTDYKTNQKCVDDEIKKVRDLQLERDNLKLRIFYMSNAKGDIRGDIAIIRRVTDKAEAEKAKLELEKMRQDLMVNRLKEQEAKLKEDIDLYQSQLHNQSK
jgi:coiled-coil domain-containing protein 40